MGWNNRSGLLLAIPLAGFVASCSDFREGFEQGFDQGLENAILGDGAHWIVQDKFVDQIDDTVVQRAYLIGQSMEIQVVCMDGTVELGALLPNGNNPYFDTFVGVGGVIVIDVRFDDNQAEQIELFIEREDAAIFPASFIRRVINTSHQELMIRVPLIRGEAVTEVFNLKGTRSMLERMSCMTDSSG